MLYELTDEQVEDLKFMCDPERWELDQSILDA
jgi:hypothetical protein